MSDYRRWFVPGGTFFFTLVMYQRRPVFAEESWRTLLRNSIEKEKEKRPFTSVAMVLLPDHFHAVWTLPPGDADYPLRWQRIKDTFTKEFLASGGTEGPRNRSRRRKRERAVWQRRYWEHTVRDEADLERCVDYTHWNPRKHGLVTRVRDWPWSTFHQFVEAGQYDINWGAADPCLGYNDPEWGE